MADSYCTTYQKVLREPKDAQMNATRGVKDRTAANEVTFRCKCEGWTDARCKRSM